MPRSAQHGEVLCVFLELRGRTVVAHGDVNSSIRFCHQHRCGPFGQSASPASTRGPGDVLLPRSMECLNHRVPCAVSLEFALHTTSSKGGRARAGRRLDVDGRVRIQGRLLPPRAPKQKPSPAPAFSHLGGLDNPLAGAVSVVVPHIALFVLSLSRSLSCSFFPTFTSHSLLLSMLCSRSPR